MPLRLLKPYNGQAAGTLFWSGVPDELVRLRYLGIGDDNYELATDYQAFERDVTTASVNVVSPALIYNMNSSSAQTVNLGIRSDFLKGTTLKFVQLGTGQFTIVPATGVTVNTALASLKSLGQYRIATLINVAPNTWVADGGLGG